MQRRRRRRRRPRERTRLCSNVADFLQLALGVVADSSSAALVEATPTVTYNYGPAAPNSYCCCYWHHRRESLGGVESANGDCPTGTGYPAPSTAETLETTSTTMLIAPEPGVLVGNSERGAHDGPSEGIEGEFEIDTEVEDEGAGRNGWD